jgi:hypothetical protein
MPQKPAKSECALAYAIWDSENSVRMIKPADIDRHIARAIEVKRWLVIHGHVIRKK